MKKSFYILEINKVIELFKKYAKTIKGIDIFNNLTLSNEKKYVIREYKKLDEMYHLYENYGELPIYSKLILKNEIDALKAGKLLEPLKLNLLKDEIYSSFEIVSFISKIKNKEEYKVIFEIFSKIKPCSELYNKISKSIGNDGSILDSASKDLFSIRNNLRNIDKRIHSSLNSIIQKNKDKMNGDNYVFRNGHYAIPISTSLKSSLFGVVLDISDSGATTFIEPYEIAEMENEKNILLLKERDEISKILSSFRQDILFYSHDLIFSNEALGELDFLISKVKFMKEYHATIPTISIKNSFKFKKAKHPLLDQNICVANDFLLDENKRILLISGPNAGGKTVALKTIGTLAYMVKLALPLNVEEGSECAVFNNIFVDIGDNQSLENNLSTFSSQISNISSILKSLNNKDLVIFDELCNGTDPKEGEALSIAITKYLLNKRCLLIISSHYSLLKKFGLENENILSASFIFDEKKIRPTFKLLLNVSGKSYGFAIANKFGIDKEIVEEAKSIYEKNYLSEEDKRIEVIEDKERALSFKEEKLRNYEKRLNKEQSLIDQEKNKIKIRTEKLNQNKSEEFDRYLDAKYKEINDIYNEFIKEKNAKKALDKLLKINIEESENEPINVGDYVLIKGLDVKGQVTSIKGNKINVNSSDGFSFETSFDSLKKIPAPKQVLDNNLDIDNKILNKTVVSSSLNLIGYHTHEGVEMMEDYISKALVDKKSSVKVIHGFGSGRLRQALWEALKKNKHVSSFSLGPDGGSTIINLK